MLVNWRTPLDVFGILENKMSAIGAFFGSVVPIPLWVLALVAFAWPIFRAVARCFPRAETENDLPLEMEFLTYTFDSFLGVKWLWSYAENRIDDDKITARCPECECLLDWVQESGYCVIDDITLVCSHCYMTNKGMLHRIARGVYTLPEYMPMHGTFSEVALNIPNGVICLLSALQFHELTSQMPYETWVAIETGSNYPRNLKIPMKIIQLSKTNFSSGIETFTEGGVKIRVYSPAKTVVDCFRFRNKIGSDIAVDALRSALQQKQATSDEIWEYARCCRITKIMRPYMEVI